MTRTQPPPLTRRVLRRHKPRTWRNVLVALGALLFGFAVVAAVSGVSIEGVARAIAILIAVGLILWALKKLL